MRSIAPQNTTESTLNGSNISDTQSVFSPRPISIVAVYCVILFISLVGNSLVLAVVYRNENKRMRTISNYFIVNMSCSDLLITVCNIPLLITYFASGNYVPVGGTLGNILCKLAALLFHLSIDVSLLSLAVVTVDRFLFVFYPLNRFITAKCARILIGTTWLLGAVFSAPLAATTTVTEHRHFKVCFFSLPMNDLRAYFKTFLVVFVALPLMTMVVLYSSIVVKLFQQKIPGENSALYQEHANKRNRKVLLMLVTISTLTIVCWLPYWSVYIGCKLAYPSSSCSSLLLLEVLAFGNCALNPCVYAIFNENFRSGFYRISCALFCPTWIRSRCCRNQVNNDPLPVRDKHPARNQPTAFSLGSM